MALAQHALLEHSYIDEWLSSIKDLLRSNATYGADMSSTVKLTWQEGLTMYQISHGYSRGFCKIASSLAVAWQGCFVKASGLG